MNTNNLKRFAREARIKLIDQVGRKLEFVLSNTDPVFLDTNASQIQSLKNKIQAQEQVIDTVAYTWFNRLIALRFMDANGYTSPKVVTPVVGKSPEILQNALSGQIDENLKINRQRLNDLLDGKLVIADAQTEAYKMLLIASCNQWHTAMPFMFERISDYTELLLPDDLLSENSIITDIRNGMSDDDCGQEELIGWLYQFYISDKKDDVFEGLKKNIKITAENIPAATQLFTPRWIVRYMVENTLGKLWLTLKPNSKLRQFMPYYIEAPEGTDPAPLPEGIKGVTDITFLDPCQGSGHVLVYAFDLLTKIYEEEGYNTNEIPALILEHNLFGIDIDERAAQLAAFALTMKARSYFSRFLRKPVQPHVIGLENVNEDIIKQAVKLPLQVAGKLVYDYRDLTLYNLTQACNFGSLIPIDPEELKALQIQNGSIWQEQEQKLKEQAECLSRQYHCVVTNPPYMGNGGMNELLKQFVETCYSGASADLMTAFMQRAYNFLSNYGCYSMINLPSWMFLNSFSILRKQIVINQTIDSLLHLGRGIFGSDFGSVSFVIHKNVSKNKKGIYRRLFEEHVQVRSVEKIENLFFDSSYGLSIIDQQNFLLIPGIPIGYWINEKVLSTFKLEKLSSNCEVKKGADTSDNGYFLRFWYEVQQKDIFHGDEVNKNWVLYNKGGEFRRWYGNYYWVLRWFGNGELMRKGKGNLRSERLYFQESVTWNALTSSLISARYSDEKTIFDSAGSSLFNNDKNKLFKALAFLNSSYAQEVLLILNPTLNYGSGTVGSLPYLNLSDTVSEIAKKCIDSARFEWNVKEVSLTFNKNILLQIFNGQPVSLLFDKLYEFIRQERDNQLNREILIDDIINNTFKVTESIHRKPHPSNNSLFRDYILFEKNNESFLLNVTLILDELFSYSIGCLFGRFCLNAQGLIIANHSETLQDFLKQVPNPSFMPDEDNVIPVLEGEWFNDDIVGRFKVFLKAAFGEEHFEENLKYIEDTIGKDIRKYFVKDFYNDHIKRYKKRPIYWMFSSPKGHFKALIYMHRYAPDLCSKMLTDYLQSYIHKMEAAQQNKIAESLREDLPARDRTIATKEADRFSAMIKDCKEYAQTLYAVATKKIAIDLDDGVKVNYQKFKEVLVPIKGLEKDEE